MGLRIDTGSNVLYSICLCSFMHTCTGEDGRLDRLLETATMVMEAFDDDEASGSHAAAPEIDWAIVGHSGDEARLPLVEFGRPPRTRKVNMDGL